MAYFHVKYTVLCTSMKSKILILKIDNAVVNLAELTHI